MLRQRFLQSIKHLDAFLKVVGVDLVHPESLDIPISKWQWRRKLIWSAFWLFLNTQSGIFMIIRRGTFDEIIKLFSVKENGLLADNLNAAIMRISTLVFETLTHYALVINIRPTLNHFFTALEPIDAMLGRPFLPSVRLYSIACLIFTAWITLFNMVVAFYWEQYRMDEIKDWLYLIQNTIRKFNTLFTLVAVWLFFICGLLFVIYHKKMVNDLNQLASLRVHQKINKDLWIVLNHFRILRRAKQQLFHDFRFMVMMNCCLSVVNILTCSYYTIDYFNSSYWYVLWWDLSDVLEFIFRFWLICQTSDHIRSSAAECIPILRELRDHMTSRAERNKVTWFIIEMVQWSSHQNHDKDVDGLSLFGMLPISKRLAIQAIQAIVAMLITIFQFKQIGNITSTNL